MSTMYLESMTATAVGKKTKTSITEDLGLTEIICPNAVPVTIENIIGIALGEATAKRVNQYLYFSET